jgi:hypothetical protein
MRSVCRLTFHGETLVDIADRGVGDGGAVEHLSDGVVPLLNHRKLTNMTGSSIARLSTSNDLVGWIQWGIGIGAHVAQEPEPGRLARQVAEPMWDRGTGLSQQCTVLWTVRRVSNACPSLMSIGRASDET